MIGETSDQLLPGVPYPLGSHWDGLGVNFAVYSEHATRIELCLFDASGKRETARMALPENTNDVWHGYLPEAQAGTVYGYRAFGPFAPNEGHRFNPQKLLLDPYAKKLLGTVQWNASLFDTPATELGADSPSPIDSAPSMPKGVVTDESFNWGEDRLPRVPMDKTVIYECHVRGVSMLRSELHGHERGTFKALADPAFIDHLVQLGITTVELLPVQAILQDQYLAQQGLANYWGYSTLSYFAVEPTYLADDSLNDLRVAVRRLHAAGLEVILDVVFNHTCESDETGPTLSWRGLDNANYYRLEPEARDRYVNFTGCGNTLNSAHPRVLQMVMDSLRYWAQAFHIDGFRFDLSVTLGRQRDGFNSEAAFFQAIAQDPVLSQLKLIAEPWDLGPDGYQVGRHPGAFLEWNDRFRDTVRRFWRGDTGQRGALAARIAGSADLFEHSGKRAWSSVNYVTSHDGMTLRDLVSFTKKRNGLNGQDNADGTNDDWSANWGVEGPTEDAAITATRVRISRAMLATLLISQGTPMLTAGDEFGRTQHGNNNAYCQDNETSWLDWSLAQQSEGAQLQAFVHELIAIRAQIPSLRSAQFLHGHVELAPSVSDIAWFETDGRPMSANDWDNPNGRCLALRRGATGLHASLQLSLVLLNATGDAQHFVFPSPARSWVVRLDSAQILVPASIAPDDGIVVAAHSVVILATSGEVAEPS